MINKWDLTRIATREKQKEDKGEGDWMIRNHGGIPDYLDEELKHIDYAPIAFVTAKDGRNIQAVLDLRSILFKQANDADDDGAVEPRGAADFAGEASEHAQRPEGEDLLRDADGMWRRRRSCCS